MEDERRELTEHILSIDQRFYSYIQATGGRALADVDVTMPQLKALFLISADRGITMTQLARTLGMTLSTATGVVDRLVAHGLVRREDDPHDRRLVVLHRTEEGTALIDRFMQLGRAHFRQILERLSLEELRIVARSLDILNEKALSAAALERPQ